MTRIRSYYSPTGASYFAPVPSSVTNPAPSSEQHRALWVAQDLEAQANALGGFGMDHSPEDYAEASVLFARCVALYEALGNRSAEADRCSHMARRCGNLAARKDVGSDYPSEAKADGSSPPPQNLPLSPSLARTAPDSVPPTKKSGGDR